MNFDRYDAKVSTLLQPANFISAGREKFIVEMSDLPVELTLDIYIFVQQSHSTIISVKKLNFFGIGPKIGVIALPWLAATIVLTLVFPAIFSFGSGVKPYLLMVGIIMLVAGLVLYGVTVRSLLAGLKETRLVTTGLYRVCQNPLYAVLMLIVIPAIALMMNSWIILTVPVAGYIVFKKHISQEYKEMEEFFGEDYRKYRERTPEFFPFIR